MNEISAEEMEMYGDEQVPVVEEPDPLAPIEQATFAFVTGNSGSGKSTAIRRKVDAEVTEGKRDWGVLCSTTGVSAVSLGVTTINNLFAYFDTDSLRAIYAAGHNNLKDRLKAIAQKSSRLVLDEVSLFSADQLDIFYMAISELNEFDYMKGRPFGIVLVGDFCLGFGTPIMMADGTIKPVEQISVGDLVMGPDSKSRKVLRTTFGVDQMFMVHQTNGDDYTVNSKHSLALKRSIDGSREQKCISSRKGRKAGEPVKDSWIRYSEMPDNFAMGVQEFANKPRHFKECFVGYKAGLIEFQPRKTTIDPYFLGLWLGDGDSDCARITTPDQEIIEYCYQYAQQLSLMVTIGTWARTRAVRLGLSGGKHTGNKANPLWSRFREYNLPKNKHIPDDYLTNSEENRLNLLAGLLDSDGSWTGNRYTITSIREHLALQIKQLADQLGFRTGIRRFTSVYYKDKPESKYAWTITIGGDTWRIPCKVERKKSIPRDLVRSRLTSVLSIRDVGIGNYVGFETDGDHLFLLGDGTVAHNCQLPPIKDKFAFEAKCWGEFEKNTLRLTKVWRQDDLDFVHALNLIRCGDGPAGARALEDAGVQFVSSLDMKFEGTTIVGKNDQVNRINAVRYQQVQGKEFELSNYRWGSQRSEWRAEKGIIPFQLKLKPGALVMVLANHPEFEYANGDLGEVIGMDGSSGVLVKLKRNDSIVSVTRVTRHVNTASNDDHGLAHYNCLCEDREGWEKLPRAKWGEESFNCRDQSVVTGAVDYWPLRLAYASTVHKVQSLSLDSIQVDARDAFVGNAGMCYVSLSRARTAQGLRIIGSKNLLAKRTNVDFRVRRFI
jgi:hypothetical protein